MPLGTAIIAAAVAVHVVAWASLGAEGLYLDSLVINGDRANAPALLGALGIVATVAAILAGVGELYEVLPPQRISFTTQLEDAGSDPQRGEFVNVQLHARNTGAYINAWYWSCRFVQPSGRAVDVSSGELSTEAAERSLVPGEPERIHHFSAVGDTVDGGHFEITWWADRSKDETKATTRPIRWKSVR